MSLEVVSQVCDLDQNNIRQQMRSNPVLVSVALPHTHTHSHHDTCHHFFSLSHKHMHNNKHAAIFLFLLSVISLRSFSPFPPLSPHFLSSSKQANIILLFASCPVFSLFCHFDQHVYSAGVPDGVESADFSDKLYLFRSLIDLVTRVIHTGANLFLLLLP